VVRAIAPLKVVDKVKAEEDIKIKIRVKVAVVVISIINNILKSFKPVFQEPKTTRVSKVLLKLSQN